MKPCPKCTSRMAKKVKTPLLLKLVPGSARYKCLSCGSHHTWFKPLDVGVQL